MGKANYITESLIDLFQKGNWLSGVIDILISNIEGISIQSTKNNSTILKCKKDNIDQDEFRNIFVDSLEEYINSEIDNIETIMDDVYECEFDKDAVNYDRLSDAFDISFNKKMIYIDLDE